MTTTSNPMTMTIQDIQEQSQQMARRRAIRVLAGGYSQEFADELAGHERMHDLMMELAEEFVNREIPITDEDELIHAAHELLMNVTVRQV